MTKEPIQMAINWFNVNVPTILAVAGAAIGIVRYIDSLENRIDRQEEKNKAQAMLVEKYFSDVNAQLGNLAGIPYRVSQVEASIGGLSARQDKITESLVTAVEGVKKEMSNLSTQQAVMSSKIDSLDVPRMSPKHSMLTQPWFGGYTPSLPQQTASSADPPSPLR